MLIEILLKPLFGPRRMLGFIELTVFDREEIHIDIICTLPRQQNLGPQGQKHQDDPHDESAGLFEGEPSNVGQIHADIYNILFKFDRMNVQLITIHDFISWVDLVIFLKSVFL